MLAYAHAPAVRTSRDALESLLRARKLDVTLTVASGARPQPSDRLAPTGHRALDEWLGGGLRRGQLSEIVGAPSTGRSTFVAGALASATERGEAVALVDASDTFDPVSAAGRGVRLEQLLWIRASAPSGRGGGIDPMRALKACSLVLQAGGFGLVVFDLADVAPLAIRRLPCTTWMRLARIVEGSETAVVVVGSERIGRSAGGATIVLHAEPARWRGASDRARVLEPVQPVARVINGR